MYDRTLPPHATQGPHTPDPAQIAQFEKAGYLIFDPGIPMRVIDEAVAALKDLYLQEGHAPDASGTLVAYRDDRRIQDAWQVVDAVKAIATAPAVLDLLAALYGRRPLPFQTLNFRVGTEQKPHSDTIHFNSAPAGFMCGVWVALEDIDLDNGPLMYYPGTQAWPEVVLADVDVFVAGSRLRLWARRAWRRLRRRRMPERNATVDYLAYEETIAHRIRKAGATPLHATIRKGQAFLWASNLLHGGAPQLDRTRTRNSQVTHYFFEGCRYHTPLLKRDEETCWRQPTWIA